ncbi:MAG: PKD domain-containing protein [Candidatus Bipolaricaulota bacterium]|nr:PKD domain-containing protein [Candidatus Bipolaricaulota bacterium]
MKEARLCLLLGAAILLAGSLGGCLEFGVTQPQALFTASPAEHVIPFTASFDGTLSQKAGSEITSYVWSFGDGGGATGALVDHTYTVDGVYEVTLTVIDGAGSSDTTSLTVDAENPLPTAGFSYDPKSNMDGTYIVGAMEWIYFDASTSSDDSGITSYAWDFGDGDTATGVEVKHRYASSGTYNVTLTVTDDDGDVSTYVQQITVTGNGTCGSGSSGGSCS